MKILYVGYHNPNFMSFCEYVERAIVELGHTMVSFDFRKWLIPGRIRERFQVLENWDRRRINNNLIGKVREFQPDLLLVNGGWNISGETIQVLKKEFPEMTTVNWISDFPLMFNEYVKVGGYYDIFFASGTDALGKYREVGHKNGHWMPFACDPQIHKPVVLTQQERKMYACDVCFVGSRYQEREKILEKLSDFNLGIWGARWDRLPAGSPLKKCVRNSGMVRPEEWVKIFSAAKIVINILGERCDIMEPYFEDHVFRMTNTKLFEILACGAFQMVDNKADAMTLFEDRKHLGFYKDAADLVTQIKYFLDQPEERQRIAQTGRREVLENHSYVHRIVQIIKVVSQH